MKWTIERIQPGDREKIIQLVINNWGSEVMVVHDECFHLAEQPGFLAKGGQQILGLLTYRIDQNTDAELLSLDSFQENVGIGSALVKRFLRIEGPKRFYLTTTNDNVRALQFYQKRGFTLCTLRRNAVQHARQLKPEIPLVAENGIPIEHELELEWFKEDDG
ncbi:GNAT family N-acetyltransferase [Sporolactobacillus inulinus]|jgi:ribosomal protein S18 acetylase RimI-like enzyme|uniref:GCN5 family acetyltransferase n=1 Tax=Sporolactobacillus inulinus CASD TaxID=1069536 RepID=A0A0U1QNJ6_9BACL|nr:GNAT family N-acetyltransferase [Sporolactobacillus inulinus]KLI02355.1 GCN5 family acetyltransferase [Sporolactobacillus inulinus CASD]GEB77023.1 N-acetyltransferase [Sporolactobacillus inulinus]